MLLELAHPREIDRSSIVSAMFELYGGELEEINTRLETLLNKLLGGE